MDSNIVAFIDNSEDRMVVEYDAEYAEDKFMEPICRADTEEPIGAVWTNRVMNHLGLGIFWTMEKVEYTGDSYIITFRNMMYDNVGVV